METTFQAAETGHLVITSLHATDTLQVFDRIMSLFPAEQRIFTCARLSHCLQAVIVQKLLPHVNEKERVLANEVCVSNTAVKRVIHSGDFTQLLSIIQTGSKYKMHVLQDSINMLFEKGLISAETYELYSKK
jgi:Tfp pilus assembly pilus retraction ATPase PilT